MATRIKGTPILPAVKLPQSSSNVLGCANCKDNGGNKFLFYFVLRGNETYIEGFKMNSAGAIVAEQEFEASPDPSPIGAGKPKKLTSMSAMVDGQDIEIFMTGYELTNVDRLHWPETARWKNIAVPFAQGVNPTSGAGPKTFEAVGGEPNPIPGGTGMTKDEMAAALNNPNDPLTVALGKLVKNQARGGMQIEIAEQKVLTENNVYASGGLFRRIKETVYQVLKENGLIPK